MARNDNQAALVAAGQGQAPRPRTQLTLVKGGGGAPSAETDAVMRMARKEKSAERKEKAAERDRDQIAEAGQLILYMGETTAANALGSFAHGALGDKIAPLGVDGRMVVGTLLVGYGAYNVAQGGDLGGHLIALGSGFVQSIVSSGARNLGQRWVTPAASQPAAGAAAQPGLLPPPELAEGDFARAGARPAQRGVFLTPEDRPRGKQRVFLTPDDEEEEDIEDDMEDDEAPRRNMHGRGQGGGGQGRPGQGRGGQGRGQGGHGGQGRGQGGGPQRQRPNRFRDARPR
jgi:hypothetical protein